MILGLCLVGLLVIPAVIWIQDRAAVESSPVGNYYHYEYRVNVIPQNETGFSVTVPVVVYQNGSTASFMRSVSVFGNATYSLVNATYGTALKIDGAGNISIAANGNYNALHNSSDHKSDGGPTFSTWNIIPEDSRHRTNGTLWMSSSTDNISILVNFKAWYKSWHIREGLFNSGYHRGGGGFQLSTRVTLQPDWQEYFATRTIIFVE